MASSPSSSISPPSDPSSSSSSSPSPSSSSSSSSISSRQNAIDLQYSYALKRRDRLKKDIRQEESKYYCDRYVRLLAVCTHETTFLAPFKCKEENKLLHQCCREYMDNPELSIYPKGYSESSTQDK